MGILNKVQAIFKRDKGIKKAVDHAEAEEPNWSEEAYKFLQQFTIDQGANTFMTEDVRMASTGTVPQPPSNRAWGGIMVRAAKQGLIKREGYGATKNPKAHRTPATIWISNDLPF